MEAELALAPGVDGEAIRLDGAGDEREEREMLLFPPLPLWLPLPSPDAFFGVDGDCLLELEEGEEGGGVALARRAAFWLLRPKGESAAADGRLGAGEGMTWQAQRGEV